MISKNQIKYIRSLETKKGRVKESAFVAEGPKVVADLMAVAEPRLVVATERWWQSNPLPGMACGRAVVTEDELRKVSFLQHPQQVMAVFPKPDEGVELAFAPEALSLALDGVQDPGNLGTIIRIADWFGITQIYCSRDTADAYNPKVVQATMGSIARVSVCYVDLAEVISGLPEGYPVYGTLLGGDDIYSQELTSNGIIVMGNEGKGISPAIEKLVNKRLLIPNFPKGRATADSLNVAIATAITCSEFRRCAE